MLAASRFVATGLQAAACPKHPITQSWYHGVSFLRHLLLLPAAHGVKHQSSAHARPPTSWKQPSRSTSSVQRRHLTTKDQNNGNRYSNDDKKAPAHGQSPLQRLSKVMAGAGVASRRACDQLIEQGLVKVNGEVVTQPGTAVDPAADVIHVQGKQLVMDPAAKKYYFALNKPKGYICSNSDEKGRRVIDLMQPFIESWEKKAQRIKGLQGALPPRLFTVGRLDVASTGLIFLTNDGQWANRVIHPSGDLTKEYIVRVDKQPTRAQLSRMMDGVEIDGCHVAPREVALLDEATRLRVVVSEGKKHEVRLLVAAAGMEVMALKRVRVGGFRMPRDLRLGEYMQLTAREVKDVTDAGIQHALEDQRGT